MVEVAVVTHSLWVINLIHLRNAVIYGLTALICTPPPTPTTSMFSSFPLLGR